MLSLLLAVTPPNPNLLTCSEYNWLVQGLEDVKNDISNVARTEIRIELIRATDPKCFERS
jgi:hypothetical protein